MNWVIPQSFGAISKRFHEVPVENTLAANIPASFGVISYKGKTWAVRHRGVTTHLLAENGRDPAFAIEVVILKSSPAVSKTFYERAYVEGANEAPDCMSTNGIVPEATSPKKQAPACATCPNNAWGSRLTPDGKKAKACADNKRMAVVLMPNMLDETFGGPLLLRVPPASLQDLASYGNMLAQHGYHENALVTRIAFDMKEAYPRLTFSAVRSLTDGEADISIDLRQSAEVGRILAEALEYADAEPGEPSAQPQQQTAVPQSLATRAVAARAAAGPTPPRQGVVRTMTLTPNKPQAVEASTPAPVPEPEPEPKPEPAAAAEATDVDIPAFLRKQHSSLPMPPAAEVPDDQFMDEIDAKLAAFLPA